MHDEVPIDERVPFLAALLYIAMRDGVDREEAAFIQNLSFSVGLGTPDVGRIQDMVMATESLSSALKRIKSPRTRRILVQQAVALAWSDGRYDEAEREAVLVISAGLGVPSGWLEDVEKWAAEGHEWQQRGRTLLDAS
jgi:hypothetical protein